MSGKQLVKNSIFGVIQLILTAGLTFISVPIFINKLGLEYYGIFAIISVIGNLNILSNFGLNGALLVYIAKQGKCKESDHDIIVTQILLIILTLIFICLTFGFNDFIVRNIFSIPLAYIVESKNLLQYLIISNSLLLLGQTYTAIIDSKQKIYISNIYQFLYSLLYWGGMIITVSLGGKLQSIGIVALFSSVIWLIGVMIQSRIIWGKLEFSGLAASFKKTVIKQITYGSKIYLSGLMGFLFEPLSKILLSNFNGLNTVALFEIGLKIRNQINGIISKALYPIYPYVAKTPKSNDLHIRLLNFSKSIQIIVIPASIIILFTMPILLKIWLSPNNLNILSIFVTTMTLTLLLFSAPILIVYHYLAAKNMADKNMWLQIIAVLINIIVFFSLLKSFRQYTILISNSIAYFSSYCLGLYYQRKYFGKVNKELSQYTRKIIIYTTICIILCVLTRIIIPISVYDFFIYPLLVGTITFMFIKRYSILNATDLDYHLNSFPLIRRYAKKVFY